MGDRANVYIKEDETHGVYLYTHWGGHELPETVRGVLARRKRWDDTPYLARMIFSAMTSGSEKGETGFGISTYLCDNEHPIVVVDTTTQTIGFAAEPTADAPIPTPKDKKTFTEFVQTTAEYPDMEFRS